MKLRAILIDDEASAVESLAVELNAYCPEVDVLAKCTSAKEGIEAIQKLNPDLVFLDIKMPWMNGFEMLQALGTFSFSVVFVTAYDEFALRAFEVNAVDYLMKPIEKDKLILAVQKVKQQRKPLTPNVLDDILHTIRRLEDAGSRRVRHISLPTPEGLEFIKIDQILYAKADSNYSKIFLKDGNVVMLTRTLKQVEELVHGLNFFRTHQSYLVNLDYIKKYVKGQGGYLILERGLQVPVSRAAKSKLMELLK